MALAGFAAAAGAQALYRCTDAQGRVLFTDNPNAGKCTPQKVETPPARPQAPGIREGERRLLEQSNKRAAELDRAMADIVTAFTALRAAEARRDQGIEPIEGDRQGRRFRPEYWQRRQALQRDVDQARAQLNDALDRRNALR